MKIAPSFETLSAGFPNKKHQIDSITGTPERLGINIFFEAITQNAASVKTLKGGGRYGHMAFAMSTPQYEAIQHSLPFIMKPAPPPLTFEENDTAAIRDDKKLVYYTNVYNFELETNVTTALKNIIMENLTRPHMSTSNKCILDMMNHLLITYGEKTDDMVKRNLAALTDDFDCTGASIQQLYIRQDDLQNFAIGSNGNHW